jgi:rare lipoprotein A
MAALTQGRHTIAGLAIVLPYGSFQRAAGRKSIRGDNSMKLICIGVVASLLTVTSATAGGWATVHKYVKRSGNCAGQEILASSYSSGKRTANGERFDVNGNTAAARTWPMGTILTVTNPQNGRTVVVRINDTGPWGIAYRMGARLDLARGAAQRLGMRASQYVCVV